MAGVQFTECSGDLDNLCADVSVVG
uniref:Uncharacterized protein n=1 Tax=Arundo donax TaxID=35708 RepID=A0A0A9Q1Q0_ARUDO